MGTDPNSLKANLAALIKAKVGWEKSSTVLTFRNPSNTNVYMWEVRAKGGAVSVGYNRTKDSIKCYFFFPMNQGKVLSAHETGME